jgi:hypothetical protein
MKYHIKLCDAFGHVFLDEKGNLKRDLMPDALHPNEEGYRVWGEAMEPAMRKFLGEGQDRGSSALSQVCDPRFNFCFRFESSGRRAVRRDRAGRIRGVCRNSRVG